MSSQANLNLYYDSDAVRRGVAENRHRELVGGLWDEIGKLQFDFLRANGLTPQSKLIDIGCGCLRGGVFFVNYLDPGNYFGMDISDELLTAGYEIELRQRGLLHKLPRANLVADGAFQFGEFPVTFDFGLAVSLFTHLPAGHIRQCLAQLAPKMAAGGTLFATFFLVSADHSGGPVDHPDGIQSFDNRDPYHFRPGQMEDLCAGLPWRPQVIGDWRHPRDQRMVCFRRSAG